MQMFTQIMSQLKTVLLIMHDKVKLR